MNLPSKFLESLPIPGNEVTEFVSALGEPGKNSIRINPEKARLYVNAENVPWCNYGYYLKERPRYTSDPAFHAGAYYPQEASSMFISAILNQLKSENELNCILDLCAAPGGKTTLLLAELPEASLVHANEVIRSRVGRLTENLMKWGYPNIVITNNDPSQFSALPGFYDLILVDAPCSGEGLFRKQKDALEQWSEQNVELCSARQKRILSDIWPSLKEGGYLIYSTCTYNRLENEENLKWIAAQKDLEFVDIKCNQFDGIKCLDEGVKGYRFMPHKIDGEGFFCSVIRKLERSQAINTKKQKATLTRFQNTIYDQELYSTPEGEILAINPLHIEKVQTIINQLRCVSPGYPVGKVFKGIMRFTHGYTQLVKGNFKNSLALNLQESLKYLSKTDLSHRGDKGDIIVAFENFILGYGKCDGRRIISQYPKNWRVLTAKPDMYSKIVEHI